MANAFDFVRQYAESQGMPTFTENAVTPAGAGRPGGLGLGRMLLAEALKNKPKNDWKKTLSPLIGGVVAGGLARLLGASPNFAAGIVSGATGVTKNLIEQQQAQQEAYNRLINNLLEKELTLESNLALERFKQNADLAKKTFLFGLKEAWKETKNQETRKLIEQVAKEATKIDWSNPNASAAFMIKLGSVLPAEVIGRVQRHIDNLIKTKTQKEVASMRSNKPQYPLTFKDWLNRRDPYGLTQWTLDKLREEYRIWHNFASNPLGSPPPATQPTQQPSTLGGVVFKELNLK